MDSQYEGLYEETYESVERIRKEEEAVREAEEAAAREAEEEAARCAEEEARRIAEEEAAREAEEAAAREAEEEALRNRNKYDKIQNYLNKELNNINDRLDYIKSELNSMDSGFQSYPDSASGRFNVIFGCGRGKLEYNRDIVLDAMYQSLWDYDDKLRKSRESFWNWEDEYNKY